MCNFLININIRVQILKCRITHLNVNQFNYKTGAYSEGEGFGGQKPTAPPLFEFFSISRVFRKKSSNSPPPISFPIHTYSKYAPV